MMTLDATVVDDDRRLLRETVRSFVEAKVEPNSKAIDENGKIPREIYQALTEMGLNAPTVPANYGGGGASMVDSAILIEEMAKGSAAVALILAQNLAGVAAVVAGRNGQFKSDLLSRVANGTSLLVWSTDSFEDKTEMLASVDGGGIVLNGKLHWIPSFDFGAKLVLIAEVKVQAESRLVAIDIASPHSGRINEGPLESDLGLMGSCLKSLTLENVVVTTEEIIATSEDNALAFKAFRSVAQVALAAQANGIATAALRHAHIYALERHQFGVPISDFESTRTILGTMALNLEAARQLTFAAAAQLDSHRPGWGNRDSIAVDAGSKWFASKVAVEVAIDAIQIFGGYGFVKDYPVERLMRDAKMTQLMAGSNQILEIANALLLS
ncbi:MAG: acyl-CoA dehydrogenase family protein [Actinobacteria bacterium]|nr:acyl-CoA dehydrogenase family protein [Actinomycetota bacterium]